VVSERRARPQDLRLGRRYDHIVLVIIGGLSTPSSEEPTGQSQTLDEENGDLRTEKRKLESENSDLRAENSDLRTENADLQARVNNLEGENIDLRNQLEDAEAKASQHDQAAAPQQQAAAQQQAARPSGTKHVRVEVSCDIPCDVMIMDDNFEFDVAQQITGTKTFEDDIDANSGLLAEASNLDQSGNLYVGVYENGRLVAEDSDSQYAQVMY